MTMAVTDSDFPCSLIIHIPFPTNRLARSALGTLAVDEELSPLVRRRFELVDATANDEQPALGESADAKAQALAQGGTALNDISVNATAPHSPSNDQDQTVLRVEYKATTNRMLRVAVNGFFESLGVIVQVMEELDVDVLHEKGLESLEGVQGIEQGMTGTTVTGA